MFQTASQFFTRTEHVQYFIKLLCGYEIHICNKFHSKFVVQLSIKSLLRHQKESTMNAATGVTGRWHSTHVLLQSKATITLQYFTTIFPEEEKELQCWVIICRI